MSCKGCRLSKVKCSCLEQAAGTASAGACARCERLGLSCEPVDRPQKRRVKDTTGRLSPAVRALLRDAPTGATRPAVGLGLGMPIDMRAVPQLSQSTLKFLCSLAVREQKLCLIRSIFAIARRQNCWELVQQGMEVAKHFAIGLQETIALVAEESVEPEPISSAQLREIPFNAEWHCHGTMPCITVCWRVSLVLAEPNPAMRALWAKLNGGDTSGLDKMVRFGFEHIFELFPTEEAHREYMRMDVCAANTLDFAAETPQHLQFASSRPLAVRLGGATCSPGVVVMARTFFRAKAREEVTTIAFPGLDKASFIFGAGLLSGHPSGVRALPLARARPCLPPPAASEPAPHELAVAPPLSTAPEPQSDSTQAELAAALAHFASSSPLELEDLLDKCAAEIAAKVADAPRSSADDSNDPMIC